MNCRLNAVQDSGVEEGVRLPELQPARDLVEIVGFVDSLGRCYIEVGDTYVRVCSLTNPKLGFASRIPLIIDVTPLRSDNEVEAPAENVIHQKLLTGPQSATETERAVEGRTILGIEEEQPRPDPEPSTEQIPEQATGLHGD